MSRTTCASVLRGSSLTTILLTHAEQYWLPIVFFSLDVSKSELCSVSSRTGTIMHWFEQVREEKWCAVVQIFTVGVGVAYGQSAMLLSAGSKGKRFMLPHATALLQQPRVPPTGARQAIEVQIRWREAFNQYQNHLKILSENTGHTVEKLDYDMQRCVCFLWYSRCCIVPCLSS